MSQVCDTLVVFLIIKLVSGYPGEKLMVLPPFEVRSMNNYPHKSQFQENRSPQGVQQILHTNVDQNLPMTSMQRNSENENVIEAWNRGKMGHHVERESQLMPAYLSGREGNDSAYQTYPGSYSHHSSMPYASHTPTYQNLLPHVPQTPTLPQFPILKPEIPNLFKSVSNKVSGKTSGLLGLILSLFSGSSGLQLNGLKDVLVNSIIQPLLAAKGGLKSIIAKLAIPVVALVLINVEVLLTVWWLWEDCKDQKPLTPPYPYPKPAYNNNYNSYR